MKSIVEQLNNELASGFCNFNAMLSGVVTPILVKDVDLADFKDSYTSPRQEEKFIPAFVDSDGECIYPFADDDFDFGIYHRLISKTYTQVQQKGFGDDMQNVIEDTYLLVCWGKISSIPATDLERYIFSKIGNYVLFIQADFNRQTVFNDEFGNFKFFLPPEYFLFSIKYKVRYKTTNAACAEINEKLICKK